MLCSKLTKGTRVNPLWVWTYKDRWSISCVMELIRDLWLVYLSLIDLYSSLSAGCCLTFQSYLWWRWMQNVWEMMCHSLPYSRNPYGVCVCVCVTHVFVVAPYCELQGAILNKETSILRFLNIPARSVQPAYPHLLKQVSKHHDINPSFCFWK